MEKRKSESLFFFELFSCRFNPGTLPSRQGGFEQIDVTMATNWR